jgi:hypothetical protein
VSIGFRGGLLPGEHRVVLRYSVTAEMLGYFLGERFEGPETDRFARDGLSARLLRWRSAVESVPRETYVVEAEWAVRPQTFTEATGIPESRRSAYDGAHPSELAAEWDRIAAMVARGVRRADRGAVTTALWAARRAGELRLHTTEAAAYYEQRILAGEDAPERAGRSDPRSEGSVRFEAPCPDCGEPCEWVAYVHPPVPGWCPCQGERPE